MRRFHCILGLATALYSALIVSCARRENPYTNPENVSVAIALDADTSETTVRLSETVSFKIFLELASMVDYVIVDWGAVSEPRDTFSVTTDAFAETLDVEHVFVTKGERVVRVSADIRNHDTWKSAEITVHVVDSLTVTPDIDVSITSPVMTTDSAVIGSSIPGIGGTASSPSGIVSVSVTIDSAAAAVLGTSTWSISKTELTAGGWNTVRIQVRDGDGETLIKTIYLFMRPDLEQASPVSIQDCLCTAVELSWRPIEYCDNYIVYRFESDSNHLDSILTVTDTACTDSGLSTGSVYYYAVRAWYRVPGTDSTDSSDISVLVSASTVQCFQKTFGGMADDRSAGVVITADSQYVIVGTSLSTRPGFAEIFLVRINAEGDTMWTSAGGGYQNSEAVSARGNDDGGITAGYGYTCASCGYGDVASISIFDDADGRNTFDTMVSPRNSNPAFDAMQVSDGSLVFASYREPPDGMYTEMIVDTTAYIYKLSSAGDSIWQKFLAFQNFNGMALSVDEGDGGSIYAAGVSWTAFEITGGPGPQPHCFIAKISSTGDSLWSRTYGDDAIYTKGSCIRRTSDGGFVVAGEIAQSGVPNNVYVLKTTSTGAQQWSASCGGNDGEFGTHIVECSDGGFAVAGGRYRSDSGDYDAYIVRLDNEGTVLWDAAYGAEKYDCAQAVAQTPDGGFILAGQTESYGEGGRDMFVIKTDHRGNSIAP